MKYIDIISSKNAAPSLAMAEGPKPEPADDEVLVKVACFALNRADILQKQGKYPPPKGESEILGLELCGDIVATGKDVTDYAVGQRVFGLVAGGAYAEYACMRADQVFLLPDCLDEIQGAACAEAFLTAYQALFSLAHLEPYEYVLVHAGASGVGTAAIQLLVDYGSKVVVTVGDDEKAEKCLALGAHAAINYTTNDFVEWQKEHLPHGFNVIVDMVAGDYIHQNLRAAALDARIIYLAMMGGRYCELDMAKVLKKRVMLQGSTLRNRTHVYRAKLVQDFKDAFYKSLCEGKIKPVIDSVFDWQSINQAHRLMEANLNTGKIVITVS